MIVVTPAGDTIEIGTVETAPTIGIIDYSRRVTDDFGVTTVVERGFARRMSVKLAVPSDAVDALQTRLAGLRAVSAQWIADARFQSLNVTGFFKDFSIDLPAAAISYCTLTVEGLTVSEPITDTGADPAPEGASSTLQMLAPVAITDQVLVAASVAEDDQAEWSAMATYPLGARVMKAATHRIYESAAAGNVGNDPAGASGKWTDIGPTKRWAMFDQALGTATTASRQIVVTFAPSTPVSALAVLDVEAATVRVQSPGYDRTQDVTGSTVLFLDMPAPSDSITVTIDGPGALSVGTLLIGRLAGLGITEAAPSAGITDYSRKVVDDFGNVSVVERAFAKRMSVRGLIRTDAIDDVASRIAAVRARPSLWIGKAGLDTLTIYGFFKDFSIEAGQSVSKLSLTIEGLSKASPLPKPLTSIVAQGSVDGVNWHLGLQPGDIFMRISNDSGKTFGDAVRVAGRDAFTAYLTNSDHTLPALYDGTVTSYAGAETVFAVGIAGQDLTDSGLFDLSIVANPQNLTVFTSGRYFRVDGGLDAGEDGATLTARLTGKGQFAGVTLDQVFSLTKSLGGRNGEPPALISLSASALTARYDTAGALIPGQAITFGARRQNTMARTLFTLRNSAGAAVHGPYEPGDFARLGGSSFWSAYDPDTITLTEAGIIAVIRDHGGATGRVTMVASIEGTGLADAVSVNKVQDGARGANGTSPYNAILSNENHTLPADAAGNVLSYAGAEFTVTVFYGAQDVTGSFRLDTVDNPQVLYGPSDLYPTYRIDGGFDAGEPSASITYHFVGKDGTPHAGKRVSKVFSLSKSLGGSNGAPAALISLSASALTVRYGTTGALVPGQAITFGATRQNTTGRTLFLLRNASGQAVTAAYPPDQFASIYGSSFWSAVDADTITLTEAGIIAVIRDHGGATGRVTMIASIEGTALADAVSIQKVQDGAKGEAGVGAFTAYLTNSDHTVPASFDGTVTSYAGAESVFAIRLGAVDLTDSGQFDLSIAANPQNLTIATSGRYFRVDGGLDANEDGATITARLTGKGQYDGVVIDQVFTLSKSKGGRNGEPSPLIRVDATAMTLRAGTDGNFFGGQRIDLTATRTFMPGTTIWQLINSAGSVVYAAVAATYAANFPSQWGSNGPDSLYLTAQGSTDNMNAHGGTPGRFSLRAYVDGYSPTDTVSIQKVQDGAKGANGRNAISAVLTNESHTLPADAAGNVLSYAGASTFLNPYDGSDMSGDSGEWTYSVVDNPQGLTVGNSGRYFEVTGGLDASEATASLTLRVAGKPGTRYAGVVVDKTFGLTKSLGGSNGASPALVTLTASALTLRYDTAGLIVPGQSIRFDTTAQNNPGTPAYAIYNADGAAVAGASYVSDLVAAQPGNFANGGGGSLILTAAGAAAYMAAHGGAAGKFTVGVWIDGRSDIRDRVTIQKVQDGSRGADSTVPGPSGADGFAVSTQSPVFIIPAFPSGAPKPSWQGGGGTITLRKGQGIITAGVTYALEGAVAMAGLGLTGANFSFSGIAADAGYFTIVATFEGVSYRARVDAKKVYDGSPAFRGGVTVGGNRATQFQATGQTPIPGGSTVRLSLNFDYSPPDPLGREAVFRGRAALFYRNITDGGDNTLAGFNDGSNARTTNVSNVPGEFDYEQVPGTVSAAFTLPVTPAGDKVYEYSCTITNIAGDTRVVVLGQGNLRMEVTA